MNLDSVSRSLVFTALTAFATNTPYAQVAWEDRSPSEFILPGHSDALSVANTAVTAVPPPLQNILRTITSFVWFNSDTVAHVVTVYYQDGVTAKELVSYNVPAGGMIQYERGRGWTSGFDGLGTNLQIINGLTVPDDDILQWKAGVPTSRSPAQYVQDALLALLTVDNNFVQRVGGVAAQRTPTQAAASLAGVFAANAIGAGSVNLAALLAVDDNFIQRKGGIAVARTPTQAAVDLALVFAAAAISAKVIAGVSDGSSSPAGSLGEYASSTILQAGAVALTSNTAVNVTSLTLQPGKYWLWGNICYVSNVATVTTSLQGAITSVSATLPAFPNDGAGFLLRGQNITGTGNPAFMPVGGRFVNPSVETTYYLLTSSIFTTNALSGFGFLGAFRWA